MIENNVWIYKKRIFAAGEKKAGSRTGRELLFWAVKEQYGLILDEKAIAVRAHGKPYFKDYPGIFFNISHSGEYAVCALSGVEVGIDIEQHRLLDFEKISRRFFSEEARVRLDTAEDKTTCFFELWTEVESYAKWTGLGLGKSLTVKEKQGQGIPFPVADGYSGTLWSRERVLWEMLDMGTV